MNRKALILLLVIFFIFIGLGLPDALLGSSWNLIRFEMDVPLGYIGFTTVTAFVFTILSTYFAPKLLSRFQTKQIVFTSLLLTGSALICMSLLQNYWTFIIFAVPLGLGAGAIDFSINHYVALHYKASHMNYLHSFYGIGVLIGPLVMAITLKEEAWRLGYVIVGSLIFIIVIILLFSWKIWYKESEEHREKHHANVSFREVIQTKGAPLSILIFLVYVHIESLFGILIASYFYITKSITFSDAATYTLIYYIGLASGRFAGGVLSNKTHPNTLLKLSVGIMGASVLGLFINTTNYELYYVFVFLVGFGSGPIYPNMMHMNDKNFEKRKMSKIMSLQMTIAYVSFGVITPLMGFVFQWTSIVYFPIVATVQIVFLALMIYRFISYNLHRRSITENQL